MCAFGHLNTTTHMVPHNAKCWNARLICTYVQQYHGARIGPKCHVLVYCYDVTIVQGDYMQRASYYTYVVNCAKINSSSLPSWLSEFIFFPMTTCTKPKLFARACSDVTANFPTDLAVRNLGLRPYLASNATPWVTTKSPTPSLRTTAKQEAKGYHTPSRQTPSTPGKGSSGSPANYRYAASIAAQHTSSPISWCDTKQPPSFKVHSPDKPTRNRSVMMSPAVSPIKCED